MKRLNLFIIALLVSTPMVFGGGIVTNTNQSAAWARTLTRHASEGVDAVYYNPAGLAQLNNGFHFSLSNQTIIQTRTITNDFQFLNDSPNSYEAELMAPVFPSIYAAYKMDKWAFSAGFNIIGGGGTADFKEGLPSIDMLSFSLVPQLQASLLPLDQAVEDATGWDPGYRNITGYDNISAFSGSSAFMGIQAGATYAINDMISVAIGGRVVKASNSYTGSLDVTIDAPYGGEPPDGTQAAGDYLRRVASNPGLPADVVTGLEETALVLDESTTDAELDAVQEGWGFAPIISVNLHLTDMLNVAVKYEHHTKLELTNKTDKDDVQMFPDGEKSRSDLPGMFSVGAQLKPINKLRAMVGFDYFLDKPAYYGNTDESGEQVNNESTIDQNRYSVSASLEYEMIGPLGISAGFSTGNNGVNQSYQSDMSYTLKSNTVGGGLFIHVGELLTVNAGVVYVMYQDYESQLSVMDIPYTETYGKDTMIFAIGVDISL